jgi:LPPG:FO 2-phospho-L-lactate transferase
MSEPTTPMITPPTSLSDHLADRDTPHTVPAAVGRVVVLAGGVGGAKMVSGLARLLPPQRLTVVVNTGDDFEHWGLHISPDLDTVMYTLAGLVNPETGWGVRDDTANTLAMMARYGAPDWFFLGDRDLATHLLRTQWLRQGYPLSWVTQQLCSLLGVRHTILPMTDAPVRTMLTTDDGELAFQDYFVRRHWQPRVYAIRFDGIDGASPLQAFVSALRAADAIIIAPSNPYVSIDPILSLPAIRRLLAACRAPRVAVSPIVGGAALRGPAAKLMAELGKEASAYTVAEHYRDFLTGFVLDHQDAALADRIEHQLRIRTLTCDTIMRTETDRIRLARQTLEFVAGL